MADKRQHRTVELDGDRISQLMREQGWSVEDLSLEADVSTASVSKILRGKHQVYWSTAKNLQTAFKLSSIDDLLSSKVFPADSGLDRIHEWRLEESLSKWITASNQLQFRIWKLKHEHLNKFARGKCYDLQGMASAERERCRAWLLRHAEVCTRIGRHPHIINNLTTCAAPTVDRWWVIDEWIDGTTLADVMKDASYSYESSRQLLQQVAEALGVLHTYEIIRRELSPQSILVRPETGEVVLTEFELAKLLDGSPTVSNAEWPVDPYRAPEATTDDICRQADVYSWGRIAIHMLLGELPEKGSESSHIQATNLPAAIQKMLLSCVAISWRKRPSGFEEVLKLMKSWK